MRHYCNRQNSSRREILNPNRHYQSNSVVGSDVVNNNEDNTSSAKNQIVLPPGGDYRALDTIENEPDAGEYIELPGGVLTDDYNRLAQGGAISQRGGYNKQLNENERKNGLKPDNYMGCTDGMCETLYDRPEMINEMSGSIGVISLPTTDRFDDTLMPMSSYLRRYKGKYICIDLWTSDNRKLEKCGLLTEIGNDFLVINSPNRGETTMVDLKTIRYVSIYCR